MGTWDLDLVTGVTAWSDGLRTLYGVGPDSGAVSSIRAARPP